MKTTPSPQRVVKIDRQQRDGYDSHFFTSENNGHSYGAVQFYAPIIEALNDEQRRHIAEYVRTAVADALHEHDEEQIKAKAREKTPPRQRAWLIEIRQFVPGKRGAALICGWAMRRQWRIEREHLDYSDKKRWVTIPKNVIAAWQSLNIIEREPVESRYKGYGYTDRYDLTDAGVELCKRWSFTIKKGAG